MIHNKDAGTANSQIRKVVIPDDDLGRDIGDIIAADGDLETLNLNSEMEYTDREDFTKPELFIRKVNGMVLAVPHEICAHL
jgi:hypothetical protein